MGNSRSQPCRRGRPMYLFYLIHRTWTGKSARVDKEERDETDGRDNDASSSRCSDCKSCHYRQDSLTFDSESEMAPNAEEELLAVKPWGPQPEKERLRPPTYNAEDYAIALRRWGRRPVVTSHDSHGTLPSTTSSSSGYASGSGEMTLRQFTSVSELLNKLRADLRLAFPSFVQEFASPPADGITLLLETLRGVQLIQSSPPSGQAGPRIGTRRAALDELGCVECLAACGERCPDAPRLLSQAQPGLLALAVCLTSSLNRSRVLALQLLTKVCQAPGGHLAVSEAVSTLRLRYGEGGRFRFLAGALLAPRAAIALRVAGISFLNAFLKSASRTQTRLYIQAEACEAGLEPRILQAWLTEVDARSEDALTDLLHKEVQKWSHNCVDVEALQKRLARAEETCAILGNKVSILQEQLEKFHTEKMNSYNSNDDRKVKSKLKNSITSERTIAQQGMSSNAEDEGISSSERSSSPENLSRTMRQGDGKIGSIDNDQETTIDDVIEELRIIVKDAEEEYEDRNGKSNRSHSDNTKACRSCNGDKLAASSRISVKSANHESLNEIENRLGTARVSIDRENGKNSAMYFGHNDEELSVTSAVTRKLSSTSSGRITKTSNDGSLKIVVKSPDVEDAIVPAILYPQPPRRAPPCLSTIMAAREGEFLDHQVVYNPHDDEDVEEETLGDGSDSLLSASRLKYNSKNETSDVPATPMDSAVQNCYQAENNALDSRNPLMNNFAKCPDAANDKRESKTIRNFDGGMNLKNLQDSDPTTKYLKAYKQFETPSKSNENLTPVQRRGSKCKNEMEKRKLLRRSASQDILASNTSSANSEKSINRIEGRIRKFESLNAFENASLQSFNRFEENSSNTRSNHKLSRFGAARLKMQRSESFHHVSMADRGDPHLTRGGSDSGLLYITDYDLDPLVTQTSMRESSPHSPNHLTKSLDRIDEGLDSMIDGTIQQGKRYQTVRSIKEKHGKNAKSRNDEKSSKNKAGATKSSSKKSSAEKSPKNDEHYNALHGNPKHLRNDELYDDVTRNGRHWNFQNEVDGFRKINTFISNRNSMTIGSHQSGSRHDSLGYDKMGSKFSTNDSGVFLPSGRYDAFGLGKNRFNAGKYSGHPQTPAQDNNIGVRRNSASTLVSNRGKVTDILSGLY